MTRQPPPPRARSDFSHVHTRDMVSIRFRHDYGLGMTWKAVGAKYGLSAGSACRIARTGKLPSELAERRRLRQLVRLDYDGWRERNMARLDGADSEAQMPVGQ